MCKVTLELPEDADRSMNVARNALGAEIRMLVAVKLYELKKISSGKAAEMAGISKPEFLEKMGQYGALAFDMTAEELQSDLDTLRQHRNA